MTSRRPIVDRRPKSAVAPQVGPGRVSFASAKPKLTIACALGDGPATVTGGGATWEVVARPKRLAGVEWVGVDLEQMSIPILLDTLTDDGDVEDAIDAFKLLRRPPAGAAPGTLPPAVRIGGMVPHRGKRWIILSAEEGDTIYRGMQRVRQELTLTLCEYEPLDLITATGAGKKNAGSSRVYVVRKGDTLAKIAVRMLGSKGAKQIAADVAAIKKLNKLRDPRALKVGMRLKLPDVPSVFTGGTTAGVENFADVGFLGGQVNLGGFA